MPETPTAFPLAWPHGKERTNVYRRVDGAFRSGNGASVKALTTAQALERVRAELSRLGARYPVISTNIPLRLDGLPRSGQARPTDPGVAVYFQLGYGTKAKPIVLAVDRYRTVEANLAAIAAHIDASRAIERHGVGTLSEIFAGFSALPAQAGIAVNDWRTALDNPATLAAAEVTYREKMRTAHPDQGGSEAAAALLNAAIAEARKALT